MQGLSLEAMRMLAPSWRTVWGDDAHPVEPAETVTKALVLLTGGQNGAYSDGWGELPGRLSAMYDTVADELVFGCDSRRVAGCDILRGEHAYRNDYSSRYTAVGRFGEGRPEDGFPVAGQDFNGAAHQLGGGRDACNRRTRMFDRQEPESVFRAAAAADGRELETTGVACSDPFDNTSKTT